QMFLLQLSTICTIGIICGFINPIASATTVSTTSHYKIIENNVSWQVQKIVTDIQNSFILMLGHVAIGIIGHWGSGGIRVALVVGRCICNRVQPVAGVGVGQVVYLFCHICVKRF